MNIPIRPLPSLTLAVQLGRLVMILSLLTGTLSYGSEVTPRILMPEDGWTINTWKNTSSATLSFEEAPDDSRAIRIQFSGTKSANVSMPNAYVAQAAPTWPSVFNGFRGFVWNDGKVKTIKIIFRAETEMDGEEKLLSFSSLLKVDHKGWKLMECKRVIDFQNKQALLDPSKISSIFFTVDQPEAEIALGTLTWIAGGTELRRNDEGNAAAIFKTGNPPAIDGKAEDGAWKGVPEIPLSHLRGTGAGAPKNDTTLKIVFDAENLYILARAPFQDRSKMKATITEFDSELWGDEDIEIFLFPEIDPRKYCQFIVNPLGTRADLAKVFDQVEDRIYLKYKDWNPEWEASTQIGPNEWTAEMRIPWKTIGAERPPALLQFQAARNDTTAGEVALWAPTPGTPASGLGVLTLQEAEGEPVTVPGLTLHRSADNKYLVNATVLADQNLEGLTVRTTFCAPRSAPEVFTKTFPAEGKSATVDFAIDSEKVLNGKYLAVVEFLPGNKKLLSTGVPYYFNQTLPATVKFSDIIFNPVPKELTWAAGVFVPVGDDTISVDEKATERTVKTAAYLAKRMHGVFGVAPEVRREAGGRLIMKVDREGVEKETDSDSPEAYTLEVSPEKIIITGADERGLYYGVVTLIQLMQGPKLPNAPIRALNIADWPTYPHRLIGTYVQYQQKKSQGEGTGGYQIKRIKEWIEKAVAGNKFNTLLMGWADQINYPSLPELHHQNNFSPAEISELFDFAREHFVDASPAVLFGAHSTSWLRHFPELSEPGWRAKRQFDVTLPETFTLMDKVFNDLMDIAGEKSHYFANYNDEWWHGSKTAENFSYKGKSRQELFYHYLMEAYGVISKRGKTMVMCTDMLHPKHNGGPPWNLSAIVDRLPKDIVMVTWSASNDFFAEKGFKETWTMANGFGAVHRKPSPADNGYGQINYPLFQSLFNHTNQQRVLHYCYLTTFPTANYAWNKEVKGVLPTKDWVLQKMPAYLGSFSFQPNPWAGDVLTTIELPHTAKVPEWKEIQKITTAGEIAVQPGAVLVTPEADLEIPLAPATKASSFYILGAVYPLNKAAIPELQNAYRQTKSAVPYGLIVGTYRLVYADGTHAEAKIRLGRSMGLFQYTPAPSRYGAKVRMVLPLTANREKALTQFEMINPHPDKEIRSLQVTGNFPYAPILICGVTARSVR